MEEACITDVFPDRQNDGFSVLQDVPSPHLDPYGLITCVAVTVVQNNPQNPTVQRKEEAINSRKQKVMRPAPNFRDSRCFRPRRPQQRAVHLSVSMPRILFVSGFHPTTRARDLAYEFERCVQYGLSVSSLPDPCATRRYGPLIRCDVPAPRNARAPSNP